MEEEFKSKTIGLVTREEFKRKRENIDTLVVEDFRIREKEEQKVKLEQKQKRKEEYKKKSSLLSFDLETEATALQGYGKNGQVDTTYLPDMNREKKIEELTR